jgi:uncharacterized coiled-coil protein SlyX
MRTCLNTLFFILLLTTATLCSQQENILELIDRSDEGRDILNAIYLELKLATPNLNRGKLFEILNTSKANAARSENNQRARVARHEKACHSDLHLLHKNINENEKSEFTVTRHLNSNVHASKKNQQYIDRSKEEFNQYEGLRNLLETNKSKFTNFVQTSIANVNKILALVQNGRRLLSAAHKAAGVQAFVQVSSDYITGLSEIRVDFANTFDSINGLRPIISSLLQTMADPQSVGKEVIRNRLLRLLHEVTKALNKRKDDLEARAEGAAAVFEALIKNIAENKTRVQKLQERLDAERSSLSKRQGALTDSRTRAHNITSFSQAALKIRAEQCTLSKERNAKLLVSIQKSKNIVAQVEEILQERFGQLKSFFLERKMRLNVDMTSEF